MLQVVMRAHQTQDEKEINQVVLLKKGPLTSIDRNDRSVSIGENLWKTLKLKRMLKRTQKAKTVTKKRDF